MKKIYLSSPTMHGDEMVFIQEAFDSNWVAPLGKNVDEFEKGLAEYVGKSNGVALASGTAALHLSYKLAGVTDGDVVFCSDLTFAATANPISYENGVQVFIDSEKDTWNMCPVALEAAFKKYPNPKAVVLVHLYGVPAKIDEIQAICQKHGVPLIEDAAESLGATYNGKQTGGFGEMSIVSFNGNKIITTSGGGMLLTDDEAEAKKATFWSTQARDPALHYQHSEIGYNYRMSNIVAGIGRGQLLHLDEHVAIKNRIYHKYKSAFADLPVKMNPYLEYSQPNFWLSCVTIDENCAIVPSQIIQALDEVGAESRPIWKPMHMQPVFENRDFISVSDKPVSADIFARGLCLPSDIKMTEEQQDLIISTVRKCFDV
ncbi:MAG: aminotransferase class I/II-fold pyridoxal phosphate-dependent enzyme [Oscillospiraceae bacterium]|nr:aminotransferase class I/II-fold pyridoxal phosphate-dependent enzyme [Oscillospiraceae bacterium]